MRLYYHKTDGGAEYLCSKKVKETKGEGSLHSKYVVRIDGAIEKDAELFVRGVEADNLLEKREKLYAELKATFNNEKQVALLNELFEIEIKIEGECNR